MFSFTEGTIFLVQDYLSCPEGTISFTEGHNLSCSGL
jgi:hypothetical protein